MTSPVELARTYTALDVGARRHLERLMGSWGMLADFSFSDLLLYAPFDHFSVARSVAPEVDAPASSPLGLRFVILGQMRPTTSRTLFELDLVGQIVDADEPALVYPCWTSGLIERGERAVEGQPGALRYEAIPVRWQSEVVAVLERVWSPTVSRRTGSLEREYLSLFERLAEMVHEGIFPFVTDEAAFDEAPRVGDGVIVLDENKLITFASPNAVNALHRMGIFSSIEATTLGALGLETEVVTKAFARRSPVIDELERRHEVVVLLHCMPLLEQGEVTGACLLVRDVTDLRRRDRLIVSKDAAIREVHHRVKNNLQTISSLLRLQSRRLEDPAARDALAEAERRIRAIALVHEILAHEPGEQVPFSEIVPVLVHLARESLIAPASCEFVVEGDAGDLDADIATPLAVVIAELLQNAVEHGVEKVRNGTPLVRLSFRRSEGHLEIDVKDNGGGFPSDFDLDESKSLGLSIVRDLVRTQLGGTISVENDDGALVRIAVEHDDAQAR